MSNPIKAGFGKSQVQIKDQDLPIREFKVKLTDLVTRVAIFEKSYQQRVVIVSVDMTSLTVRDIEKIKTMIFTNYDIPRDNIWITVTHTFAAPHLKHKLTTDQDKVTYSLWFEKINTSIKEAFEKALESLQVVEIGLSEIYCPLNVNRNLETNNGWWIGRNFEGYSNHLLKVMAFQSQSGKTDLIFNYDIQPSIFDHIVDDQKERVISGDIFGTASSLIERDMNNVVMPLIGAAGDQRPLFVGDNNESFEHNKTLLFEQGKLLAQSINQAVQKIDQFDLVTELNRFCVSTVLPSQKQKLGTFEIRPTRSYLFEPTGEGVNISIEGIQINDLVILGTQPELNSSFAKRCLDVIQAKKVIISTLVNGGVKYLPEKTDFENVTYESMNTQIGPNADIKMLEAFKSINTYLKGGK